MSAELNYRPDFAGVVFVPLDGGWQLELAKEIRAAEIKVDFNLLY